MVCNQHKLFATYMLMELFYSKNNGKGILFSFHVLEKISSTVGKQKVLGQRCGLVVILKSAHIRLSSHFAPLAPAPPSLTCCLIVSSTGSFNANGTGLYLQTEFLQGIEKALNQ